MTGDERLQIGDCSLYGCVVYQSIRLKYYACLPVSVFTVAGDTIRATATDHRTCAEAVVLSRSVHKSTPRVTLTLVLFLPNMKLKYEGLCFLTGPYTKLRERKK